MNRLLREWTADEVEDDEPRQDIVLQGTPREVEPCACACGKIANLDRWAAVIRREYPPATATMIISHHTVTQCIPWNRDVEVDALGRLAHVSQERHQRSGHDGTWAECQAASCAGDRELANTTRCAGCQRSIDPATCWCGSPVDGHGYGDGHSAVPMGCECHRRGPSERETP